MPLQLMILSADYHPATTILVMTGALFSLGLTVGVVATDPQFALYAVFLLAIVPLLVTVDCAPAIFLMVGVPSASLFILPQQGIGGLKVVAIIALTCWAVGFLLGRQSFQLSTCRLDILVAGLFAVAFVNIALLSNGSTSVTDLIVEYGGSLILYFFLRGTVSSARTLKLVLLGFTASSVVSALVALWRYAHGMGVFSEGLSRSGLPGWDIDEFAAVLLLAFGLAFAFAVHERRSGLVVSWVALAVLATAIVLSYSREVFVGAAAMLVGAGLLSRSKRLRIASVALIGATTIIAFTNAGTSLGVASFVSRARGIASLNYEATSGRNILWSMGWQAFRLHPWIGLGIGNFATGRVWYPLAYHHQVSHNFLAQTQQVHSFYLGWAADAGIIGLVFLLPAVALGGIYALRSAWMAQHGSWTSIYCQGLFLAYVGYFVSQAAAHSQNEPLPYLVLALAACAWTATRRDLPTETVDTKAEHANYGT